MNTLQLNSGRNCLRYIVQSLNLTEIHIPYYICPAIRQSLQQEKIKIKFYHIDNDFFPNKEFDKDEYILYPNYFGICSKQSGLLAKKYRNLILDNAHSFYAEPKGVATFYSPRKFFEVNDGGILKCKFIISTDFEQDKDRNVVIKSFDDFCQNEISIDKQPIKLMSKKTTNILKTIDYYQKKTEKRQIFDKIHQILHKTNKLKIDVNGEDIPFVYPYSSEDTNIREILQNDGINIIKYWGGLPDEFEESKFQNKITAIPLSRKAVVLLTNTRICK